MTSPWPFTLVFLVPVSVIAGYLAGGLYTFLTPVVVFGVIPLLDLMLGINKSNPPADQEKQLGEDRRFRYITWACAPIQFVLVLWGAGVIAGGELGWLETLGFVVSLGTSSGIMGINVSHELQHRVNDRLETSLARLMLLTTGYMHWGIEHVAGHHRQVATPKDPATARLNQSFYSFWPQTVAGGFASAWHLENERLRRKGYNTWHWRNRMLQYLLAELLLIFLIGRWFGAFAVVYFIAQALIAVTLLEIVNYVEHYGLMRKQKDGGKYEPVRPVHSWNASNRLTNLFLFNLQRHSDHHYKPGRRYQLLRHYDESPQLPTGYAGMILLAAIPPLWFAVMNPRVAALQTNTDTTDTPVT